MFKSLVELTKDVTKIATAPVEMAIDTARVATKTAADVAQDAVKEVKEITAPDKHDPKL